MAVDVDEPLIKAMNTDASGRVSLPCQVCDHAEVKREGAPTKKSKGG
jgi:hypothetical protein